jgi:hypothetical protein
MDDDKGREREPYRRLALFRLPPGMAPGQVVGTHIRAMGEALRHHTVSETVAVGWRQPGVFVPGPRGDLGARRPDQPLKKNNRVE